jgi:penicillin amidase
MSLSSRILWAGVLIHCICSVSAGDRNTSSNWLEIDALREPVRILRDSQGLAHVFADNDHDAYFGMGWVHAQDRIFQMDYSRRQFAGTLAELMGESYLASDIEFRTLGVRRAAEASIAEYDPEILSLMEAYGKGINAFLTSGQFTLPAEYAALELTTIQPWTLLDTATVVKGIAFGLSLRFLELYLTDALLEYQEAGDSQGFDGRALFDQDLFRAAPFDRSITVQSVDQPAKRRTQASSYSSPRLNRSLVRGYLDRIRNIPTFASFLESGSGSNFWVIGGQLSESGHPLLANDPHQPLDYPSLFYPIHLVVASDPRSGPMNVTGISFAGAPAVPQGCNETACWGSTVNPLDLADFYQESVGISFSPLRLTGTFFDGELEPLVTIQQTYWVNQVGNSISDDLLQAEVDDTEGGLTYLVPRRNMGPIISLDTSSLLNITALSLQFSGLGATFEAEAFLRFHRVSSVLEFREALQFFDIGSQNWAYADVDGNIAYFTAGEVPLREDLQSGQVDGRPPWFVRDGTHQAKNEWLTEEDPPPTQAIPYRILPFEELPQVVNPSLGYLANANSDPIGVTLNNDVLTPQRPGGGILYFNPGYVSLRMGRITAMIEDILDSGGRFSLADIKQMQADNALLDAEIFVPYITEALQNAEAQGAPQELSDLAGDSAVVQAVGRLAAWDFTTPTGLSEGYDPGDDPNNLPAPSQLEINNSVAATIYALWRSFFVRNTIDTTLEKLGVENQPDSERSLSALRNLLENFSVMQGIGESGVDFFEVEGISSAEESRDYLILESVRDALDQLASTELSPAFGQSLNQNSYRWGKLHRVVFDHPLGFPFSVPEHNGFVDLSSELPGLARSGGYDTVDASEHSVRAKGINSFMFNYGPARRFVAVLDPAGIEAYQIIPGGISGDPQSGSYTSQLADWLTNRYQRVLLKREDVLSDTIAETVLVPPEIHLSFPYYRNDEGSFTAFAASNLSDRQTDLRYQAWTQAGEPSGFPSNPSTLLLGPNAQLARLGTEIFGSPPAIQNASVQLSMSTDTATKFIPSIASFTQFGGLDLLRLDGGVATRGQSRKLYFTRLYQGESQFRGVSAETYIVLANPNPDAIRVELCLLSTSQQSLPGSEAERTIPGRGFVAGDLKELLGLPEIAGGYLEVTVIDGEGAVGFQQILLDDSRSLIGLNAALGNSQSTLFSAQLATIPSLIFTSINLINTSPFERNLQLQAIPEDASGIIDSPPFVLAPGEAMTATVKDLFLASPSEEQTLVGSLRVQADGPGVIGDVIFADPVRARFAAALPLQNKTFREAVFGHVANLGTFFTGLAIFNPSSTPATISITVFDTSGDEVGGTEVALDPGGRISRTLAELVPEAEEQAGGFIRISSDVGLIAQELFGKFDLSLQSAVLPTVIR